MGKFLVKRLLLFLLSLWGITVIVFFAIEYIPANPARVAAGPTATAEQVEAMAVKLGLDKPLLERYVIFLKRIVTLDFGNSIVTHQPIVSDIKAKILATAELTVCATIFSVVLSVFLGILAAKHPGLTDNGIRMFSIAGSAIPSYWLALLLQLVFYMVLGWLPAGGRISSSVNPPTNVTGFYIIDSLVSGDTVALKSSLQCIILPAISLSFSNIGLITRMVRTQVSNELSTDYVRTARAKGVSKKRAVTKHALRNALNPIITTIGIQTGYMLAGTVLVENIYQWPGLGTFIYNSIVSMDFMAIAASAIVLAVIFVIINLIVDILYTILNPEVRVP